MMKPPASGLEWCGVQRRVRLGVVWSAEESEAAAAANGVEYRGE